MKCLLPSSMKQPEEAFHSLGSSVSRPSISLYEFSASDVFRIIDFRNRKNPYEANGPNSSSFHTSSESDEEIATTNSSNIHRSHGLSKAAFARLQIDIHMVLK
jgi:hypothetical protein